MPPLVSGSARTGIFRLAACGESKDHIVPPDSSSSPRVAAPPPIVALHGVAKTFANGTQALDGLDLDVRPGEFVSLLGPSGCGKSTALRLIAGLAEPTGGTITWGGGAQRRAEPARHRLRVPGADPDAVGDGRRQRRPAAAFAPHARVRGRAAHRCGARARRARVVPQLLSARAVRRHEDARVDRARARDRPETSAHGRAVRGARRDHPFQAQRRSLALSRRARARPWCSSRTRCSNRSICRAASW